MSNIGRLQTTYQQAYEDPGQRFQSRFEERNWLFTREVALIAEETLRSISISLTLLPMVLKVPESWVLELRNTVNHFTFHLNIQRISSIVSDCENDQSIPIKYLCKASPIMRLEDGTTRTDWYLADQVLKVGNTLLIQKISSINNNSKANCNRLVNLLKKLFKITLSRRLNDLEGKVTGTSEYQHYNLMPGICFESCKLQQVWPQFMSDNTITWDMAHQALANQYGHLTNVNCANQFRKFTQLAPGSPIHQIIRNSYRYLIDWNCCTRITCPLTEGRTQSRRGDWKGISGPPKRVRREPLTLSAVGAAVVIRGIAGTAAGGLTSFVMSNSQQSKINQEIVNLGKRIGELINLIKINGAVNIT